MCCISYGKKFISTSRKRLIYAEILKSSSKPRYFGTTRFNTRVIYPNVVRAADEVHQNLHMVTLAYSVPLCATLFFYIILINPSNSLPSTVFTPPCCGEGNLRSLTRI